MKVFFEQVGEGPTLVLLHGWGLHSGLWGPLIDELANQFRVVLVDLPGHGFSDTLPDLSVETMTVAVETALADIERPATILGWSMGAFVAFELAHRFPERFKKLVWIAGTPSFIKRPGWEVGMDPQTLEGFAQGLKQDYRATLKRFISLNGGMGTDRPLLKTMQQQAFERSEIDLNTLDQGLTVLRDNDIRKALSESTMPMLLLQGTQDRLVHPDTVKAISNLREVESQMIEGAGHAPFLVEPVTIANAVREFSQ
ncbi:MAG: alpha/beta fold hydrolase [Acidiferrobacterales bacterium]